MTAISAQMATFTSTSTKKAADKWRPILIGLLPVYTPVFQVLSNGCGALKSRHVSRLSLLCSSAIQAFAPANKVESDSIYLYRAPYLVVASLFAPLAIVTAFQEALYKRDLDFMLLTIRQFVALAVSAVIGVSSVLNSQIGLIL